MEVLPVFKQANTQLKEFRSIMDIKAASAALLFITLNTLKIAVFNTYTAYSHISLGTFLYKFAITAVITLLAYAVIFNIRRKFIFVIFYVMQAAYIFANLAYYLYFHNYLHLSQSSVLLTEGLAAAGHLSVPRDSKLLIVFIDLPVFLYLTAIYIKVTTICHKLIIWKKLLAALCISVITLTEAWNYAHSYSFIHFTKDFASFEPLIVERYGTLLNSLADAWICRNDQKLISNIKYGKEISSQGANNQKPNFVVIQVESLDSNIVNKEYKGIKITPFLNSLAKKCIYFPYTLSYHKAGGTSDCEFSIFNSVEPLDNFPSMKIMEYSYPNSFINILRMNSYSTAAFHGNISTYFSRHRAYPRIGFQKFYDMAGMGLRDIGWGAPDSDVFGYVKKQIIKQKSPFFYHIITMTSHGPFTNSRYYYNNPMYSSIPDTVVRDYFNSMSYVDSSVGNFVSYVKSNVENTYIVIIGDHTPGISNNIYSQASFYQDDKYFEFVPVMILTPDGKVHTENKLAASFLDIAPTVLHASAVPFTYKTSGMNLLEASDVPNIPFKAASYGRSYLFNKILHTNKN